MSALSAAGQVVASSSFDGTAQLWAANSGACLRVLRPGRRYERLDLTGLTGITEARRAGLLALGDVEHRSAAAEPTTPLPLESARVKTRARLCARHAASVLGHAPPAFGRRSGRTHVAVRRRLPSPPETEPEMQLTPSSRTAAVARAAAYRRLTFAILGLDVPTLAADLRAQRLRQGRPARLLAPRPRRVA